MAKRELIDTKRGTSFVESDDVGRAPAADRRTRAKATARPGDGDKGDRRRATTAKKSIRKMAPQVQATL